MVKMSALDLDAERAHALVGLDVVVEVAVEGDGLVVLRGLEVLRHVRVEVVLPREPAPLRDRAVEREPDADGLTLAVRARPLQDWGGGAVHNEMDKVVIVKSYVKLCITSIATSIIFTPNNSYLFLGTPVYGL